MDRPTLIELIGKGAYQSARPRQRQRLLRQVEILHGWNEYGRAAGLRKGEWCRGLSLYAAQAAGRWGRGLSPSQLRRWVLRLNQEGAAALLDRRGRTGRPPIQVDVALVSEFRRLRGEGVSCRRAYQQVAEQARREARVWPSQRTIRSRFEQPSGRRYLGGQLSLN